MSTINNAHLQNSHKAILETFKERYRAADRKERRKIVNEAWDDVKKLVPAMDSIFKAALKQVHDS
jgi:hypothetical protein